MTGRRLGLSSSSSSSTSCSSQGGVWTIEEHTRFLEGLEKFKKGHWKEISLFVGTRTARQTRTHAQKYYEKIARRKRGLVRKTSKPQKHHAILELSSQNHDEEVEEEEEEEERDFDFDFSSIISNESLSPIKLSSSFPILTFHEELQESENGFATNLTVIDWLFDHFIKDEIVLTSEEEKEDLLKMNLYQENLLF